MADHNFVGRTALISGSTSGIGLAIAEEFSRRGMQVVVSGINLAEAERAAAGISGASAVKLDVREEASWVEALDVAEARHGPLAVLVSNAGVAGITLPLSETSLQAWEWTRSVNLDGAFLGLTHGARRIRASGLPGHIIATSSMSIFVPPPQMGTYVATKAAVVALCEALHQELGGLSIGVSVLLPGPVRTNLVEGNGERVPDGLDVGGPSDAVIEMLRRGRDPSDVAKLAADALGTDRFWLFTHPELEHRIDTRTAEMKAALHWA
ncbi:MAG: SDR family oxidoreductase [Sphingobium sp.]